jgi:hypothetical protein
MESEQAISAPDVKASLTILLVAALALSTAWFLPWWVMKARAPQYGQRTLVVECSPSAQFGPFGELT